MIPAAIARYLDQNHAQYFVTPHPTAYTAQQEAAAAHIPGHEWAKTVVCFADEEPILAVVPAPLEIDLTRLRQAAHARSLRLAREAEFAALYQDCEVGAMPPFGPLFHQRVLVDKHLTTDSQVSFNAGSHRDAIRMPYQEFERLVRPVVAEFAAGPSRVQSPRTTMLMDPVCGVALDEEMAAARSDHRGERYLFCSLVCKMEFDDNPDAYATK